MSLVALISAFTTAFIAGWFVLLFTYPIPLSWTVLFVYLAGLVIIYILSRKLDNEMLSKMMITILLGIFSIGAIVFFYNGFTSDSIGLAGLEIGISIILGIIYTSIAVLIGIKYSRRKDID